MSASLLLIGLLVLLLAWSNGANDVSKGIATLMGSGQLSARKALLWGSFCTLLGGLAALLWGAALIKTFSSAYVQPQFDVSPTFLVGVVGGAAAWVTLATRLGWPVSTTHALLGALVGSVLFLAGVEGLRVETISYKAVAPLLGSPLMAIVLCLLMVFIVARVERRLADERVSRRLGSEFCHRLMSAMHWLSSGAISFARGMNDVPKIAAFLILALTVTPEFATIESAKLTQLAIVLVTGVMVVGGVWRGFRVLRVLSHDVTPIEHNTGLSANLGTSMLVLAASPLGLPVSTTHVSTGSLFGLRIASGRRPEDADALNTILFAWLVTLPVAAGFAATGAWLTTGLAA